MTSVPVPPAEVRRPAPDLSVAANTVRFGGYAAAEARLFEVLGGWARERCAATGVQRVFAEAAATHARRAAAWRARVPVIPGVDADTVCRVLPPDLVGHLDALGNVEPGDRVAAAAAVGERLRELYRTHLATVDAHLDGPTSLLLREMIATG